MARPLRLELEGAFYHITARGNERKNIYTGQADYLKFLEYLRETKKKFGILIHGYVLMTNHYHLLIETPEANLSRAMHHINGSYTNYINIKKKRCGHLFQGRYKSILVDRDSYLMQLSRYVHLNPVRAGLVQRPADYHYSSYQVFTSAKSDDIVTDDMILGMMDEDKKKARTKYRVHVEAAIGLEMESPLKTLYGGMILGRERFIKETLKSIKQQYLNKGEISHRKKLRTSRDFDEILGQVAARYKVSPEAVMEGKPPAAKKIAVYMVKKHTGLTHKEIGDRFGGLSYSAVAKACRRLEEEIDNNRTLRRIVTSMDRELSNVKG